MKNAIPPNTSVAYKAVDIISIIKLAYCSCRMTAICPATLQEVDVVKMQSCPAYEALHDGIKMQPCPAYEDIHECRVKVESCNTIKDATVAENSQITDKPVPICFTVY